MKRFLSLAAALTLAAFVAGCAGAPAPAAAAPEAPKAAADSAPLSLRLVHVNDTHAKLEPALAELKVDIDASLKAKRTFVELGGFARLWKAVEKFRAEKPNTLFVHAGDVFQGTLYFTQYSGAADRDFLNAMGLDAQTLGNHEFDKGPAALVDYAKGAKYPVVCANIDVSGEPALAPFVKPYAVKEIGGARVGLIGLITETTNNISSPGPNIKFLDPAASAMKAVVELEAQGVNKIVVLSHLGYDEDRALAARLAGVDVIVSAHSHTLAGDFKDLGLKPADAYPAVVNAGGGKLLQVSSWQWANAVGVLDVDFDGAGRIVSFKGEPKLLAGPSVFRVYDLPDADGKMKRVEFKRAADGSVSAKEYDGKAYAAEPAAGAAANYLAAFEKLSAKFAADPRFVFVSDKPEGAEKLKGYAASVEALKKKIATVAAEDLKRMNNRGPGPLIADSMIWKTGADIAIMNPGGVRVDLAQGEVSVAQVYELQPFANTLMTLDVTGAEAVAILEDMTDFQIGKDGKSADRAFVYVANLRLTVMVNGAKGSRVKDVQVRGKDGAWAPIDPAKNYKLVVNNFMGTGGDANATLGKIPAARKYDTGFIDSEAMLDFVLGKTLSDPKEELVKNAM